MGLTWGTPTKIKEGATLVVNAPFPTDKNQAEEFWNLWKKYKEQLKKDGFGLSKYRGSWRVAYYHTVTSDSYEETTTGDKIWEAEFKKRCSKWENVIQKTREVALQIEESLLEASE